MSLTGTRNISGPSILVNTHRQKKRVRAGKGLSAVHITAKDFLACHWQRQIGLLLSCRRGDRIALGDDPHPYFLPKVAADASDRLLKSVGEPSSDCCFRKTRSFSSWYVEQLAVLRRLRSMKPLLACFHQQFGSGHCPQALSRRPLPCRFPPHSSNKRGCWLPGQTTFSIGGNGFNFMSLSCRASVKKLGLQARWTRARR